MRAALLDRLTTFATRLGSSLDPATMDDAVATGAAAVIPADSVVLVNRGWVYSPDGSSVDRARWRERDTATVVGYVEQYAPDAGTTAMGRDPRVVRRISRRAVSSRISRPLAPYYLVQTSDTASSHPVRREMPALDEGPHRGYAIQWFSFAVIAVGGAVAITVRERRMA